MQQHDVKCSVENRSGTQCRSSKNNPCLGDLQRNIQSIESIENQADVDTTDAGKNQCIRKQSADKAKTKINQPIIQLAFPKKYRPTSIIEENPSLRQLLCADTLELPTKHMNGVLYGRTSYHDTSS